MRKTKIICTIGPASSSEDTVRELCLAGMNVARLNFSHGSHPEHQQKIDVIKKVRQELGLPISIMLDTKGPEFRIKTFAKGKASLRDGDTFSFTTEEIAGDNTRVSVNYKGLISDLSVGDTILVANGLLIFQVMRLTKTDAVCTVIAGGELSDKKSMSFPNKVMSQVYLSEQDKLDLLFGIKNEVDYVACSFVSRKQDLIDVAEFMNENGGGNIELIAKIENRSGVDNIEEICTQCSGIMVARGDMGVEIPFEQLPAIQKNLITKCRYLGKRVITATEMLESMINNPRPTRAEISDVANAVYDGTSAIMLSGETAQGKYPVLTVKTMSKIAVETENHIHYSRRFKTKEFPIQNIQDAASHATCGVAIDINARAIVACTKTGKTARMISRFRCPVDIIGMTTSKDAYRRLAMSWGVTPVLVDEYMTAEELFTQAAAVAKRVYRLSSGDNIVIAGGSTVGHSGATNLIKIDTL